MVHLVMPRRSKYGNVRVMFNGRNFDSKREAQHAARLEMLRKAVDDKERVVDIQYQIPFELKVNGKLVAKYIADFRVRFADGRVEIHDAKGVRTDVYKLKKKFFEAMYPYRIIEI